MNIIQAIKDPNLFRPYLADKQDSILTWRPWMTCLRVIYGLPLKDNWQRRLVAQCTGRDPNRLPRAGFRVVLLLDGRRSGKSKIGGLIGGFEASLSGLEAVCSPGELPMLSICSPTKDQSKIILSYTRAALASELLNNEVVDDVRGQFTLANGVTVRVLTGEFRRVRSFTQIAVIVDEAAFFGTTEDSKNSDTELIRSIRPSLVTTHGRLIAISTKYKPSGWCYSTWKRHFGNDASSILVWDAASRVMNPTLSQADIDAEIEEDPTAARAEFLNEWREDIEDYLPRSSIEACVSTGRKQLLRRPGMSYVGFADVSGGRQDPMALCIGHRESHSRKVVIDLLRQWPTPCNPLTVVGQIAHELKQYGLAACCGDRYAAEYNRQTFRDNGIRYMASEQNKSELYLALIPVICSREIELPDDARLVGQLASLERKTRSGGRDSVDHPAGGHDDLANVVAGVAAVVGRPRIRVGSWFDNVTSHRREPREGFARWLNNNRVKVLSGE